MEVQVSEGGNEYFHNDVGNNVPGVKAPGRVVALELRTAPTWQGGHAAGQATWKNMVVAWQDDERMKHGDEPNEQEGKAPVEPSACRMYKFFMLMIGKGVSALRGRVEQAPWMGAAVVSAQLVNVRFPVKRAGSGERRARFG
eukprot:GGOE01031803.1.p2 GENE.GGOE01031803.1~~GGOE01031803.1.p2  ORF type:complete len:142 (+),score=12.62 GGOE01031803.1:102-527(+)